MSSEFLFTGAGDKAAQLVDRDVHKLLGPFLEEFVTSDDLGRVEFALERIARGLPSIGWHSTPIAHNREILHEIIKVRRHRLKTHPVDMDAKAGRWLEAGYSTHRDEVESWVSEQRARMDERAAQGNVAATPFTWTNPATLPRRAWLYGRHHIRQEVSATISPGGGGKTTLATTEAVAMVTGRNLLGHQPPRPLRVWFWNGEEPADELRRRFGATMKHYRIRPEDIGDRLFIDNGHDRPLVLAEDTRDGTIVRAPLIHELVRELRRREIDVFLLDPFVSTHSVSENDNNAIQKAASAWKQVAVEANVAIGFGHHTRKLGGREATAEDSRGADALISKVRDARVLNGMTEAEATRLGLHPNARFGYFWTGPGGKSNMSARTGEKVWFRFVGVDLGNGLADEPADEVATVERWSPPHAADDIEPERLVKLGSVMGDKEWRAAPQAHKSPDWIGAAVADAFNLRQAEGWERKAKALVIELERRGVIVARSVTGPKRRPVPVFIFEGGRDEEGEG